MFVLCSINLSCCKVYKTQLIPHLDSQYIYEIRFSRVSASMNEVSWCTGSSVNHSATAQRLPFVTGVTPCMFSLPAENPTIRPHFG